MDPHRRILHVDMDAFYASVEALDHPEYRGKPLIVAYDGPRSVVCAASYEARKFGVRSALPLARAKKLCPQGIVIAPRFERYREISDQIHQVFRRYADRIEPLALDEAWLDVSTRAKEMGSATAVAQAIRHEIREKLSLTCSAGVSYCKFLAKIASDQNKPDGIFVIPPSKAEEFLQSLPLSKIPGVGPRASEKLKDYDLITAGDARRAGVQKLRGILGSWGAELYQRCMGEDEREVAPYRERKSISVEHTYAEDLSLNELALRVDPLCQELEERLRKKKLVGTTLCAKIRFGDFRTISRSLSRDVPFESVREFVAFLKGILADLPTDSRIRLMGLGVSHLQKPFAWVQGDLRAIKNRKI